MRPNTNQKLRLLAGRFVVEHSREAPDEIGAGQALAIVDGPDGRTVFVRRDEAEEGWRALWNGDEPHDPEAVGMLSAIVGPLAAAGVPVLTVSTFTADIVLVPEHRLDGALSALREAGHRVAD